MFGTEDEYTKAIRGASIHAHGEEGNFGSTIRSLVVVGLLVTSAYSGFNYFTSIDKKEKPALAKVNETISTVVMSATHLNEEVEDEYLAALNNMEVDVLVEEKKEKIKLDTKVQASLSEAMSSIIDDSASMENSTYAKELIKEIKADVVNDKVTKSRTVIVQKGDTLASLSAKFYGDSMKYDRIIENNSGIIANDGKIYAGETIYLPY